jgi:hypothetical protein
MKKEPVSRIVRIVDLVAEELEREAGLMPPSKEIEAAALRKQAKGFRESKDERRLRVWEATS